MQRYVINDVIRILLGQVCCSDIDKHFQTHYTLIQLINASDSNMQLHVF